ncbi:anti-repressor SinI family protein [Bacillus seohaeanensis]|uniref:Anti-repressor SinI family protein n=1 Tax=Bacillus seohaeanensis TaxID=284580 RepID=A0ABW5RXX6_9BACI
MGKKELDVEWIQLIKEAMKVGIKQGEIREFLQMNTSVKALKPNREN